MTPPKRFIVDDKGEAFPEKRDETSTTGVTSESSSSTSTDRIPPPLRPAPNRPAAARSSSKQGRDVKGKGPSKYRRRQKAEINDGGRREPSPGEGPSHRRPPARPTYIPRPPQARPVPGQPSAHYTQQPSATPFPRRNGSSSLSRSDSSHAFVPQRHGRPPVQPQSFYNGAPQVVPYASGAGYNYFSPQSYPMPQYMPAPQPYSQPARVPTPKPSPEHKELEEMKRLLGLMEERQKAEEEQKKQEAREQEIRNDAEKELIARTMEMERVKEEAIREIEQVKLEVERKAREGLEAEDQRRRLEQEERERCDRIAREKVEAEFRIKDENERRIEEERVRRMKEMEEKVAQELEERRKLQEERDEELARFRQQIRDEVRAEFLRERQYLSSSLGAGGSSLCSSSPESLSSTSTISATRSLSLRSPEQISPKGSGSPPAFVTPAGEIQVMGVQVPDDRPPLAVLDTDLPKSSVVDPFVYLQDRSRPSTPAAEENDEIEQTSKGKGQHPRYSRSQPQASRSRDRRCANEDLKADFTHRGPPRSPCHSYGSESELMNMSTSKISDDEWSDVSELGAAPDSNQDSDHVIEPGSAYTGEDASAQMHGQSGLTPNTSISSIDFRKGRVQVDQGSENDMKSRFRAPEDDTDNLEKRKHAVSPFSIFQFLITEESSEESEGDDEGREDDADSDDGGAALTNQHMPQMANDILAKDGAGEQLDRDQDCLVARIDPVQRSPSRDSPLLLLLKKHISDFEATSRRKNFTHTRSQAQDWTQEDGSSNASSSYSGDSDPMWDHPDRLKPYLVFPYCMGGRINRSSDSFRFKKPTEDLALTPTSSPFSSEDQPSMQMAIVPCFMIPASMVRSVMQVPIFSAESISRHGFR